MRYPLKKGDAKGRGDRKHGSLALPHVKVNCSGFPALNGGRIPKGQKGGNGFEITVFCQSSVLYVKSISANECFDF